MRLKIRDSHLTCKVSNKYLNVCESVYVVEWNKRWSLPFPCCPVNRQCLWRKPWWKKKLKERFFQEFFSINKTFIFSRRLETRLYFYKVLTVSWYFLISSDPKSYLVGQLLKWLHDRSKGYFLGLFEYACAKFVFKSVFIFLKNYLPKIPTTTKRKPKCRSLKLPSSILCVI